MGSIIATTPDELDLIPVHDAWFDPDDVAYDEDQRTLSLTFAQDPAPSVDVPEPEVVGKGRLWTEYRAPLVGWRVTVFHVTTVHVEDGWGDMGMLVGLVYSKRKRSLTFKSNGKLEAAVDALRVEASGGDEVVAWSRRRVGRGGGVSDTRWK